MADEELSVVNCGKESEFEWKIKNFSLSECSYLSADFKFEGESWYLRLFPSCTDGYMDLSLWRSFDSYPIDVEFLVSVKTTNGMKSFERREIYKGHIYGRYYIKKWINQREFINRQREFLSSGCLTILLTMQKAQYEKETPSASAAAASSCSKDIHQGDKISLDRKFLSKLVKCAECDEVVSLNNWFDHKCHTSNVKGESGALQSPGPHPKDNIARDFKKLFFNQENSDVVLRVQGQEFSAHQAILTARSPVFASTFRCNMKEKETGTVDIEDIDPSCFPEFLCFLYCGEIDKLSAANVRSLFSAADKYQILDLRAICLEFMKTKLCVDTFCDTIVLALLHAESELINSCTDYFIRNAEEIIETVQWQTFVDENPTQSNELFIKYVKSTKKSNK